MNLNCANCGRAVTDGLELCTPCVNSLRQELRAVPGLVSDMTITRARLDRMSSGLVRGKSAENALPIRLDQYDNRPTQFPLDNLTNEVVTWARLAAEELGQAEEFNAAILGAGLRQMVHNQRHRRRDPAWLSTETAVDAEMAAIWLADYAEGVQRLPAVVEMHDAITSAIARCRKAIDRLPELSYKGPCPHVSYDEERQPFTCSADLYVERGEDYVSCPRCWTHHRVSDLERAVMREIDDRLFTAAEIERLTRELGEPIPAGTIRSWHSRDVIAPHAWKQADGTVSHYWMRRSDPPMYKFSEVRDARNRGEA